MILECAGGAVKPSPGAVRYTGSPSQISRLLDCLPGRLISPALLDSTALKEKKKGIPKGHSYWEGGWKNDEG